VPNHHFNRTTPTPSPIPRVCSSAICADRHFRSAMVVKLWFASTANKKGGAALHLKKRRERRMAKAPPSAKRDRIKAFTPALVDYTNDVIVRRLVGAQGSLETRPQASSQWRRWSRPTPAGAARIASDARESPMASRRKRSPMVITHMGVLCRLACRDVGRAGSPTPFWSKTTRGNDDGQ